MTLTMVSPASTSKGRRASGATWNSASPRIRAIARRLLLNRTRISLLVLSNMVLPSGSITRSKPPSSVRWTPRLGFAMHSQAANTRLIRASAAASVRYTTSGRNGGGRFCGKVQVPGKVSSTLASTVPSRGCRFFRQSAWCQLFSRRRYAARWRASSLSHCRHCASVAAEFSASSRTSQAAACVYVSEGSGVLFKRKTRMILGCCRLK
jgi:hypothetical protein